MRISDWSSDVCSSDLRASKVTAVSAPTLQVNQFFLNYGKAPLNDARVRKAMNLAINRDQFTKVTTLGLGQPASSLLPVEYWAHDASLKYSADIAKAKKLLAEAGYPNRSDERRLGKECFSTCRSRWWADI